MNNIRLSMSASWAQDPDSETFIDLFLKQIDKICSDECNEIVFSQYKVPDLFENIGLYLKLKYWICCKSCNMSFRQDRNSRQAQHIYPSTITDAFTYNQIQ